MPKLCPDPEAHEAHMQINGECPWCGATDDDKIREPELWDFVDHETVDVSLSRKGTGRWKSSS